MYSKCGMEERGMVHSMLPPVYSENQATVIEHITSRPRAVSNADHSYGEHTPYYRDGLYTGISEPRMSTNVSPLRPKVVQPIVPLAVQAHPYPYEPDSGHSAHSAHPSPGHSPVLTRKPTSSQNQNQQHAESSPFPEVPPLHRSGTRGIMRRLAPTREGSKGGITTVQPGEEEHTTKQHQHTPAHSLPPSTWRTSPGNSPLDAEMTDHVRGMNGPASSANVSPVFDQNSVATKRKLSLRKSLISMSPFHAPSSSATHAPNASPKHSPPSSQSNTVHPSATNSNNNSEPSSPWGMGHPFPTQHPTTHANPNTQHNHSASNFSLGKRRHKSVNSEASVLRGQIAAKEYEVQRITKDLERRREKDKRQELLTHPSSGIISRVSDPKPKTSEAAAQLYQHSQELAKVVILIVNSHIACFDILY
jgi:hypothetical protein